MDFSTLSNKTNCTEIEEIGDGELSERYYSLKKQFDHLLTNFEVTKQELHDTKRSYQTALDVQSHLNAELESHQVEEEKRRHELNNRVLALQEDLAKLRKERTETVEQHSNEIKKYETEIRRLQEENASKLETRSPVKDSSELEEARVAVAASLSDAAVAKAALEEAKTEIMQWRLKTEELVTEIAEIRAAMELRREELKASSEREAALIADLTEARALLHQCTDSQDLQAHAAKGNSIFAEVEDKRQEMAKTLLQMKQTNARLRRELASKQSEVDALLHEKQTIWEQQTGASAHYDRELIESYEERITQLEGHCERQRRELAKWFKQNCEPTEQGWLSGVMDHLKNECEQLRAEVLSRGVAQLANANQIRELRRKMAILTANSAKTDCKTPPTEFRPLDNKEEEEIVIPKAVKKLSIDDAKKKVSFI